jgi:hypothetical protein
MLIAQVLGEYGALSGGFSGVANLLDNVEYTIRDAGAATWTAIFFSVVVVWFFFLRAR